MIRGQSDPKTCLNLTILVEKQTSMYYLQKASIYEALGVKLTPVFCLRVNYVFFSSFFQRSITNVHWPPMDKFACKLNPHPRMRTPENFVRCIFGYYQNPRMNSLPNLFTGLLTFLPLPKACLQTGSIMA